MNVPYRVVHAYLEDNNSSAIDLSAYVIEAVDNIISQIIERHENEIKQKVLVIDSSNSADEIEHESTSLDIEMEQLGLPMSFGDNQVSKRSRINEEGKKRKATATTQSNIYYYTYNKWNMSDYRTTHRDLLHQKYNFMFPPCPSDLDEKYWDQRYRLLSKFDDGVKLDLESWYSITPEIIAHHITDRCIQLAKCHNMILRTALDGFCGCGGNAMSLARVFQNVICVDLDPIKISNCQHNSSIYQVNNNMEYIKDDIYNVLHSLQLVQPSVATISSSTGQSSDQSSESIINNESTNTIEDEDNGTSPPSCISSKPVPTMNTCIFHRLFPPHSSAVVITHSNSSSSCTSCLQSSTQQSIDIIFLAPPWGGPDYRNSQSFDLRTMIPSGDGFELVKLAASICDHIVLMIPKNIFKKQFKELQKYVSLPCVVEEVCLHKKLKMKVVYFGKLFASSIPVE